MKSMSTDSYWRTAVVAMAAALFVAGCSSASSTSTSPKPLSGGTVRWAEIESPPNYILPLESVQYYTVNDSTWFSHLMYPPIYTFGVAGKSVLNSNLSIAQPPKFSNHNTVVTITLKHWLWSNGQPLTARDVIFWMNLASAASDPLAPAIGNSSTPGPGWGGAVPGAFPYNIVSYQQTGTYTVVFHLNASYNPTWYLDNELSQIYPMPQAAWDKMSASGPLGNYDSAAQRRQVAPASAGLGSDNYIPVTPGTATSGALGVAQFLNTQSLDISTYGSNPLWSVVDGPFRLAQFTTSGYVKMVPNRRYSGSPRPAISAFEELPFTTDTAEFNALRSGSLTIGYLPPEDVTQRTALEKLGYSFDPWNVSGIDVALYNFTNQTVGPIFDQLYFRQAFQSLINQPEYIKAFNGGIGTIDNGPIPPYPPHNPYVSSLEAHGTAYPFDAKKATTLLSEHGWAVHPGGITACADPGSGSNQCGAGIKSGQPATFTVLYANGITPLSNELQAMQSTMKSAAGITLALKSAPIADIFAQAFVNCTPTTPCNGWDIVDWGSPDTWFYTGALPTGGVYFSLGGANGGDYSSPVNTANIAATHIAATSAAEVAAIDKYENYVVRQLPMIELPNGPFRLMMYKSNLNGYVPQDPLTQLFPQDYSLRR